MAETECNCPVCHGTLRKPATGKYKEVSYGYDKATDTVPCTNCGGQYQTLRPTGVVPLRPDGTPCTHEYTSKPGQWTCTTIYTCIHCGDHYMIDSSD